MKIVEEETFVRAALAAFDPDLQAYENIEGLTYIEKEALGRDHVESILVQLKQLSKDFYVVLATCCLAAITQ